MDVTAPLTPLPRFLVVDHNTVRLLARGSIVMIIACSGLVAGCSHKIIGSDLRVWAVSDDEIAARDTTPEIESELYSERTRTVRLGAAVNETVAFQVLMRNESSTARVNAVSMEPFESPDSKFTADSIRIYREQYITTTDYPSWYLRLTPYLKSSREIPDLLVPIDAPSGAVPIDLDPGRSEALWVEVHVPIGTPEGEYTSRIRLTMPAAQSRELAVLLTVWPFALPQTRHLTLLTGVDTSGLIRQHLEVEGRPYTPARLTFDDPVYKPATAVLDATMRLLHDHRCSPMMYDVQPTRQVGSDGAMVLDWSDYDRIVSSAVDGTAFEDRAAAIAWPLPITDHDPAPDTLGGWGSEQYEQMVVEYLRQCAAHFAERGWLDRNYLWLPVPAHDRGERYKQFRRLGEWAKKADPRINFVCDLSPQSMVPYGWQKDPFIDISAVVQTWATPASLLSPSDQSRQREGGKRTWFSPDEPPYCGSLSVVAPAVHPRSLAWEAFRYGLSGVFMPAINNWSPDGNVIAEGSEHALIWPGKPYGLSSPIPSIRLKRLLRGADDYEYLWLLLQNGRGSIADLIASDLFSYGGSGCYGENFLDGLPGGWITDSNAWALGRRLLARELSRAVTSGPTTSSAPADAETADTFEGRMEWGRLAQAVRKVRSHVEGVRVRMVDHPSDELALDIEASISVFNATRQPFNGRATLADLPAGWKSLGESAPIRDLPPLRLIRRNVKARAPSFEPNPDGVFPIQFSIGEPPQLMPGRLCGITSQRVSHPLQIDGRLDDWPLGTTNVAADFLLVGAQDVPKEDRRSPDRPALGTTVFVCNDSEYLYIGFNCEDDQAIAATESRSNTVAYDGLWPHGEDLLEVVLDPTGKAIAAGDVLHILLKMNGVVVTEHGPPCLEAVSPSTPWPAKVSAAIDDKSSSGRWTAEIRIPIASLGAVGPIWGINFARYNNRLGEYASWSGARQYLYSPITLGNIRLSP